MLLILGLEHSVELSGDVMWFDKCHDCARSAWKSENTRN